MFRRMHCTCTALGPNTPETFIIIHVQIKFGSFRRSAQVCNPFEINCCIATIGSATDRLHYTGSLHTGAGERNDEIPPHPRRYPPSLSHSRMALAIAVPQSGFYLAIATVWPPLAIRSTSPRSGWRPRGGRWTRRAARTRWCPTASRPP